ncbi:MAG: VanZ family protein [Clostridia bacterium]|nr:VanZ family protein [Clostridia bacterium]
MNRGRLEYTARAVLFTAISLTVLFIWSNSAATPVKSAASSDRVAQIIRDILPPGRVENFLVTYIRKIAHFTEYSLLAIETSLLILFIHRGTRLLRFLLSLTFGLCVAFCDEGIQALTGRGNSMLDVAIDAGGYFLFSFIVVTASALISMIVRRKNA